MKNADSKKGNGGLRIAKILYKNFIDLVETQSISFEHENRKNWKINYYDHGTPCGKRTCDDKGLQVSISDWLLENTGNVAEQ